MELMVNRAKEKVEGAYVCDVCRKQVKEIYIAKRNFVENHFCIKCKEDKKKLPSEEKEINLSEKGRGIIMKFLFDYANHIIETSSDDASEMKSLLEKQIEKVKELGAIE